MREQTVETERKHGTRRGNILTSILFFRQFSNVSNVADAVKSVNVFTVCQEKIEENILIILNLKRNVDVKI